MPTLFMLASNWDQDKVKLPIVQQPKIDGVRAGNLDGLLTGRSLKAHANEYTTDFFSRPEFVGLDGEMAALEPTHPDLCRTTTSAISTISGEPRLDWHVFDYLLPDKMMLPYEQRYLRLRDRVSYLNDKGFEMVKLVPGYLCTEGTRITDNHATFLAQGYEGSILRDPNAPAKQGRSTVREGGLLRIKDFEHAEAIVVSITEGRTNNNEATIDARGRTERSTHAQNMVPNGMLGAFECIDIETKLPITVSAGKLPHDLRRLLFLNPELTVGKIITYQHFPKGRKDAPRFPTFHNFRAASDIDPRLQAMVK